MGKGVSETEADVQRLLRELMPLAERSLVEREAFSPLAAWITEAGALRRVDCGEEVAAPAKDLVARLLGRLRGELQQGTGRAAAVAADVKIWRRADGDEASDAVSVHVEHQSGYCVDLLIPYKVRKGMMSRLRRKPSVMFRKMIAQESERSIFRGRSPDDVVVEQERRQH